MKKSISLGDNFKVDLPKLMDTRLLIAANSGGGKSWALRRLLEQTNGEVQQIVIDLEGEFYSLREKFDDYLLIGKGGDMTTDVRAAALLATKLLELDVSAIIDLSELKFHERKHFVRLFLESLIEAPEELRHPVMVVLDEAHHFAPQVGDSEATSAVIDIMTRGRKREICGVLATQRVSKLHKDAIAECNNKMFGRTGQDIDVKRTADELGFAKSAREAFETLRNLEAGEFFAFGTAIGSNVERYKVGAVETTHFRRGKSKGRKATPPTAAIKKMLAALKDLPQEAEKKNKTEKELRAEIATLKGTVTRLEKTPKIEEKTVTVVDERAIKAALRKRDQEWGKVVKVYEEIVEQVKRAGILFEAVNKKEIPKLPSIEESCVGEAAAKAERGEVQPTYRQRMVITKPQPKAGDILVVSAPRNSSVRTLSEEDVAGVSGKTRAVLKAVVSFYPEAASRSKVAAVAVVKQRASTFRNCISKLKMQGLIETEGDTLRATPEGVAYLGDDAPQAPQSPAEARERWRGELGGITLSMFDFLVERAGDPIGRGDLAVALGLDPNVSTFRNALSKLNARSLVALSGNNVSISDDLLD